MIKHSDLIIREQIPLNAEPPLKLLRQNFVTPKELFYIRNHGSIPNIDPADYRLSINGSVGQPLHFSLNEIREKFPKRTVMATLYCAGNRRDELIKAKPIEGEEPWSAGAISNAVWGGVPLFEVLEAARIEADAQHVAFSSFDEVEKEGEKFGFGGSIPIQKAMSPEVLLAYEMNGEPLTCEHGFPLRVVVPGYIGARSVKWLSSITLQTSPSSNYFQQHAYKLFAPEVQSKTADWTKGQMLGEITVNSVICDPFDGETILANPILIEGYAIATGDCTIKYVELSTDGGEAWMQVELQESQHPWTWQFWRSQINLKNANNRVIVRAWDSAGNTQPENIRTIWNFKGYMNNSWHQIEVNR
ncbi:MAG: molybdopterin-dependent oxidoreductase [Nostoc sp.]|uniref:molybdopterin-dependent oxidoreductase n=1 Tax=Nostoc sp. TaxID=1180 RepID=UPI002FFC8A3D